MPHPIPNNNNRMRSGSYTRRKSSIIPNGRIMTNILSQYSPLPILRRKIRFKNSSSSIQLIQLSSTQLAYTLGIMANSSTVGMSIVSTLKFNGLEIVAPASGQAESCSIKLFGSGTNTNRNPNQAIYSTAMNDGSSYLKFVPKKDTILGTWLPADYNMMNITLAGYAIIEFDVSYQIIDASLALPYISVSYVSSGMTPGYIYYACLDGSTRLVSPIGLTVF